MRLSFICFRFILDVASPLSGRTSCPKRNRLSQVRRRLLQPIHWPNGFRPAWLKWGSLWINGPALNGDTVTPVPTREASSLRRVFNELAITHRQFRLRSGQHASPALRDAARAFKEAPSFPQLVLVAAFLEEDGLLEW